MEFLEELATIKGCKEYFQAILDNNDEEDLKDNSAIAFYMALKSGVLFLDTLQAYQNKYGKLSLEDFAKYKEVKQ